MIFRYNSRVIRKRIRGFPCLDIEWCIQDTAASERRDADYTFVRRTLERAGKSVVKFVLFLPSGEMRVRSGE